MKEIWISDEYCFVFVCFWVGWDQSTICLLQIWMPVFANTYFYHSSCTVREVRVVCTIYPLLCKHKLMLHLCIFFYPQHPPPWYQFDNEPIQVVALSASSSQETILPREIPTSSSTASEASDQMSSQMFSMTKKPFPYPLPGGKSPPSSPISSPIHQESSHSIHITHLHLAPVCSSSSVDEGKAKGLVCIRDSWEQFENFVQF